jgi:hypothetical protein
MSFVDAFPQVTALMHGVSLDVPVRSGCDLCCLYARAFNINTPSDL